MARRTQNQASADEVDMDIFRLMSRCQRETARHPSRSREAGLWTEAYLNLSRARTHVRSMMAKEDIEATQ